MAPPVLSSSPKFYRFVDFMKKIDTDRPWRLPPTSNDFRSKKDVSHENPAPETRGMVVHWAARYDLLLWILTLGRERRLRERLLAPAHLERGEAVLDVGCGTGALAIAAKRAVGPGGEVHGIDPSPEMIARATKKARRKGANVEFHVGVAESLEYPDARFDVVLSTVMLHHLPKDTRRQAVREMRRVLKPGGRALLVDFVHPSGGRKGLHAHFHRHGKVSPQALIDLANDAGLAVEDSGPIGMWDMQFVLGVRG